MSATKQLYYTLCDLYQHVRPYEIPLEEQTIISKLGCIIREYLYNIIEFKVNCRIGVEDRLISCCASLLPLSSSSSCSQRNNNKYCKTDFYVAFNIRRAQSWNEPNAVLFQYPKYSKSTISDTARGIQLDFLAKKQLKCMIMATFIKSKAIKKKAKKRRGSTQPMPRCPVSPLIDSSDDETPSIIPKWGFRAKSQNISISPHKRVEPPIYRNRYNSHKQSIGNTPTSIAENVAILYPQDNLLWSYFKNKAKIIEQNQWLPIVSLWRQNNANIVYMLRGSSNYSNISTTNTNRKKKKTRSQSVQHDIRSHAPSPPIPEISPREKTKTKRKKSKTYKKPQYFEYTAPSSERAKKRRRPKLVNKTDNKSKHKTVRQSRSRSNAAPLNTKQKSKSCSFSPKRIKRGKSKSNYFGNNVYKQENEEKNPCKFYQITITEKEIDVKNLFDFPHINISHELTWFDIKTKSLLLIINNNKDKTIELQIVKHNIFGNHNKSKSKSIKNELTQSTTLSAEVGDETTFKNITTGSRRKKEKKRRKKSCIESNDKCYARKRSNSNIKNEDKKRQMSASQLFHIKLQNESLRIPLNPPRGYSHLFRDCQCLKFFHHKQSNSYILLLEKYEKRYKMNRNKENVEMNIPSLPNKREVLGKLLLKIKINFETTEIEEMSFGIINEEDNDILMGQKYDIIGYDYNRSLLIVDTFYEPLSALSCNPFSNKGQRKQIGFNQSSTKNLYNQYNKWFSFASKPFGKTKKRVVTKKFAAFGLDAFVYHWKNIYHTNQIIKS